MCFKHDPAFSRALSARCDGDTASVGVEGRGKGGVVRESEGKVCQARVGGVKFDGQNDGLYSAHPGGVQVLLCDGSARFISDDIDMFTLRILATRDDAQAIPEY